MITRRVTQRIKFSFRIEEDRRVSKTEFNPFKLLISPNIVSSQKRKLKWVKRETDGIICISESTKKDAKDILGLDDFKLSVAYPGIQI